MLQRISRGDVYFYNFGSLYDGSVQGKNRPCVVISNNKGNSNGTTVLVAPITTRDKSTCRPWQAHYCTPENRSQIILLEQIQTVNIRDLYDYQGHLDELTLRDVDAALAIELDLNTDRRELDQVELLQRLDDSLINILNNRLDPYEGSIIDNVHKLLETTNNTDITALFSKINDILNTLSNINSKYDKVNAKLNDIENIYNNNSNSLDKILCSLINIFNDTKSINKNVTNKLTIRTQNKKSKKRRYTVDDASEFIKSYYNDERSQFMIKYGLSTSVEINNRLVTMKNVLNRNGINWRDIKNNVKTYNLSQMSEEEQMKQFGKIYKYNSDVKDDIHVSKSSNDLIVSNNKLRAPAFNYSRENCLQFIADYSKLSLNEMCVKYSLTGKQLSNRKWLVCSWLKNNGVPFTPVDKRKK